MVFFREVVPGIYLGDYESARELPLLGRYQIAAVLTVGSTPDAPHPNLFSYRHVLVDEDEDEPILHHLPVALSFIEEHFRESKGVLIDCESGIARCAAFAMAFLMKENGLSLPDAVALLRATHPDACPHEGFLEQLTLFHHMGCILDMNNTQYRRLRLAVMARERERFNQIESSFYTDDPEKRPVKGRVLRCRGCRRPLVEAHSIIDHEAGASQKGFGWRRDPVASTTGAAAVGSKTAHGGPLCTSYSVEPLEWMEGLEDLYISEGKLACPKCAAKLGSYSWVGSQCSCSAWISPAFMIHRRAVDDITPIPPRTIRQPPLPSAS